MAKKLTKKQSDSFLDQINRAKKQVDAIQRGIATPNAPTPNTPSPLSNSDIEDLARQGYGEGDTVPGRGVLMPDGTFKNETPTLNYAQQVGAAGRGEYLTPEVSKQIEDATNYGVPMGALGDKNKSGKSNFENPKGYVEPRLTPEQSEKYIKSFGLEGILGVGAFAGMTAREANQLGLAERKKRTDQTSANTSFAFNPETMKRIQRGVDKLNFALDYSSKDPFEPRKFKQDAKNNALEITSKEIGQLFTSPDDVYTAYQFNPQLKATLDKFIKKGGTLEGIAKNVSAPATTPNVVDQTTPASNVQSPSDYLANLSNPNANKEAEKKALEELSPESDIAQEEIMRQAKIPNELKSLYFGDEKSIGILQMKKEQAIQERQNLEERKKDDKRSARDKAQLEIESNNADVKAEEAKIEENRIAAKNYMTARLASLGALQTTGAAVLALQTLETKYQGQVSALRTKLKFANRKIELNLNDDIDKIENDTNDKILKIQEDLTKDGETIAKEILKAQNEAEKQIYTITSQYSRTLRERTSKYTEDMKKEAEKQAKEYAKILSGGVDFTSVGNVTSKSKIVSTIEKILQESRGSDGYVNSDVYAEQLRKWIEKGGTTRSFVASFPTKLYSNPNDPSLPPTLRYAKESQTLPRDAQEEDLSYESL